MSSVSLRVSRLLAALLLAFGAATAVATARIAYWSFSPVLFYDQWAVLIHLMQSNGHLSLSYLWAQHNEHRIPWEKLAMYADLRMFGGRNVSLLIEIYIIQCLNSAFLIWIFRRYKRPNRAAFMTIAGWFIFSTFYPIQIENFFWGFQVAFVTLPFAAAVAIGAAIIHSDVAASRTTPAWFSWPLAISLAAAFVAETSLASGILLWPVLLFLSFVLRMPGKTKACIAGVGALAGGAFLWRFQSPGQTAKPLESLHHPLAVGEFVRDCLAWTWDSAALTDARWPSLVQLLAISAAVVVVAALGFQVWRSRQPDRLRLFLLTYAAFLLLTLFVIALGRINFGVEQAGASRYQAIALGFWACFGALLLLWRVEKKDDPARLLELQILLFLFLLAAVPRYVEAADSAKAHQRSLMQTYLTLLDDPSNSEAGRAISPFPDFAAVHAFLKSHYVGADRDFPLLDGVLQPIPASAAGQLRAGGFRVRSADECAGRIDWVRSLSEAPDAVIAGGWAWSSAPTQRPWRIILTLDDGSIAGAGRAAIPRPDVQKDAPRVTEKDVGWAVKARLPQGRTLRAFLVSADSTVCAASNQFVRR